MTRTTISFVCTVCALTALIAAQDGMAPPTPAVELAKFEPLVGNWSGKGVFISAFVSNLGECGEMEMRFAPGGKQIISTQAATMMGMPVVQRFVLDLDDNGHYLKGVGHSIFGAASPMESFEATYTKKQ